MPRFKLKIEYDGTRYYGWQVQKGQKTVQGEFIEASKKVFGTHDFEFYGSGRTDSGVHATGQIAHLDVKTSLKPEIIVLRLNDALPNDICIISAERVSDSFHARYDAVTRSYIYVISKRRSAFGKNYVWWIKDRLDVNLMRKAVSMMVGFKDFKSFTDPKGDHDSTLVDLSFIDIYEVGDLIVLHVVGSHFLWKMVRRMTGVIVEIGRGKLNADFLPSMFEKYSDIPAKHTSPPSGLFLNRIYYKGESVERGDTVLPTFLNLIR